MLSHSLLAQPRPDPHGISDREGAPRTAEVHGQRGKDEAGHHQHPEKGEEGPAAADGTEAGANGVRADGAQHGQKPMVGGDVPGRVGVQGSRGIGRRWVIPWRRERLG